MAGLLILAGAVLFLTKWFLAPYLFAVGAAGMAVCFLTLPTKDMEFRERIKMSDLVSKKFFRDFL